MYIASSWLWMVHRPFSRVQLEPIPEYREAGGAPAACTDMRSFVVPIKR
jgi:hypothetical protein